MDNPDVRLDILRGVIKEDEDRTNDKAKEEIKGDKKDQFLEKKIQFQCSICGLCEMCHYFGSNPPFVKKCLEFSEECYVMLDPFSPYNPKTANSFLVLGSECSLCQATVCVECSIYFTKRFCINCAQFNINEFPQDVQNRIVKVAESHSNKVNGK